MERRSSGRAADHRTRRGVPAIHRSQARRSAGHPAARQPGRDGLERGGQRRHGGLSPRVHADPRRARAGDVRSGVRQRTQQQYARRGNTDHAEWAAHQAARFQLRTRRHARWVPGEHVDRALLAAVPPEHRGVPAAQDGQGHLRQHVACRHRGERGRARRDRLAAELGRHGLQVGRERRDDRALHRRQPVRRCRRIDARKRCSRTSRTPCCARSHGT